MTLATSVPAAAVRARTIAASTVSARLTTDVGEVDLLGGHTVLDDGRIVVLVSADGGIARAVRAADRLRCRLLLVDIAPVALPHRERGRLVIAGTLALADADLAVSAWAQLDPSSDGPAAAVALELTPAVVVVTCDGSQQALDVDALRQASPDPLARAEAALLQHLAAGHDDLVQALAARACGGTAPLGEAIPLRLGSHGITLRVLGEDGRHDLSVPFPAPVEDPREADRALAALLAPSHRPVG